MDETDVYEDEAMQTLAHSTRSITKDSLDFFNHKRRFDSEQHLSPQETMAVVSFLAANHSEFSRSVLSDGMLKELVTGSKIHKLPALDPENAEDDLKVSLSMLFKQGSREPEPLFTLVLQGRVRIIAGDERFRSEAGPWTPLGIGALHDRRYRPDFTAEAVESTRVLRISIDDYIAVVNKFKLSPRSVKEDPQGASHQLKPSWKSSPKRFFNGAASEYQQLGDDDNIESAESAESEP